MSKGIANLSVPSRRDGSVRHRAGSAAFLGIHNTHIKSQAGLWLCMLAVPALEVETGDSPELSAQPTYKYLSPKVSCWTSTWGMREKSELLLWEAAWRCHYIIVTEKRGEVTERRGRGRKERKRKRRREKEGMGGEERGREEKRGRECCAVSCLCLLPCT